MVNKKSLATFVRTVGNQVISGFKHFLNNVKIGGDLIHDPDPLGSTATNLLTVDAQGVVRKATSLAGATGTVTSVALTAPSAFTVTGSPITTSGTIAISGAGTAAQYVRGDGQLGDFPTTSGGGSSVSYYLNGSVNQGTLGGNVYREFSKIPIIGTGTDFTIAADGYIAQFITDANDPSLLEIPGGNWNFEFYFSSSSSGGTPSFYVELSKYDGTTFTPIANNSAFPEFIAFGTTISAYFGAIAVPQTTLAVTDRLAIRVYVIHSGRTITLHTENGHLCQVITTFSTGLNALNGLTKQVQYFATGSSGTDFNISSVLDTHTFNIPTASGTNRGLLSSSNWTNFTAAYNDKINSAAVTGTTTKTLTLTQQDGGTITASWTDINTDAVTSVFGRTGAVVATSGDYTTAQVTESGNLYYTEARVNANTNVAANTAARHNAVTIGTANGLSLSTQVLSLGLASASTNGALSSTDWNTFNSKQNALTNPVTGTGTTNYVPKWTSGTAIGNSAIYDNAGNIGIGLTNADYPLTVSSINVGDAGANLGIILNNVISTAIPSSSVKVIIGATNSGFGYAAGSLLIQPRTGVNAVTVFATEGNEKVRITSAGNVGIGTTSPTQILSISRVSTDNYIKVEAGSTVSNYSGLMLTEYGINWGWALRHNAATDLLHISYQDNTPTFSDVVTFNRNGNVGIGTTSPGSLLQLYKANGDAEIISERSDAGTAARYVLSAIVGGSTRWRLATIDTNSFATFVNGSERMRITSTGNVGIGATSPFSRFTVSGALSASTSQISIVNTEGGHSIIRAGISGVTNNGMSFVTANVDGSSQNVRMVVGATGNVGIGTTSTTSKLHVLLNGNTSGGPTGNVASFQNSSVGSNAYVTLFGAYNAEAGIVFTDESEQFKGKIGYNNNSEYMYFQTDGSEKVRITAAGNVGIGTTSPAASLHIGANGGVIFGATAGAVGTAQITTTSATSPVSTRFAFGTDGTGWQYRIAKNTAGTIVDLITVADSGNVGIGTTSPNSLLEISGASPVLTINRTSGTTSTINFNSSGNNFASIISNPSNGENRFSIGPAVAWGGFHTFYTDTSERMRITAGGNVGIGTTSPTAKLDISAGTNLNLGVQQLVLDNFANDGVGITFSRTSSDADLMALGVADTDKLGLFSRSGIVFATGGATTYSATSERVRITEAGNVGIGTTSPGYKLTVIGDIYSSNVIRIAGTNPFYFEDYGGGWFMQDSSYLRTYNQKSIWTGDGFLASQGGLSVGYGGATPPFQGAIINANVGIGTTSPGQKLSVEGGSIQLNANNAAANYYLILNKKSGQDGGILFNRDNASDWQLTNGAGNGDLIFYSYGTASEAITFKKATANVGIGTTSPTAKLHISGTTTSIKITDTTYNRTSSIGYLDTANLYIANDPASNTFIGAYNGVFLAYGGGNVGIGTTSPSAKLHVIGNVTVSATLSTAAAKLSGTLADSFNQVGTPGQVLSSTGTGVEWVTGGGGGGGTTITVKEEGTTVSSSISTLNFVGSNVNATASGSTATISVRDNVGTGSQYLNDLSIPYAIPGSYTDTVNINGTDIIVAAPNSPKGTETVIAILTFGISNITGADRFNAFYFRLYNGSTSTPITDTEHRWSSYMSVDEPTTVATFHIPIKINDFAQGDDIYVQCQTSVLDAPEIYYCALSLIKGTE
jgi:hypothetical protein